MPRTLLDTHTNRPLLHLKYALNAERDHRCDECKP